MRVSLRRVVFLLAGGAVAVALLLVATPVSALLPGGSVANTLVFLPIWLALSAALGLLPGVREIEVAGARDLLRVGDDAVVTPEPMRWEHRWRTALWVLGHQAVGLVTGIAVTAAVLLLLAAALVVGGRREVSAGELSVDLPGGASGIALAVGCVVTAALLLGVVVGCGRAAAWAAPLLLGPTGSDRLAIAEARLARGRAHLRLSQDLHDGVGHSLSAISLQAAAAERGLPPGAGPAREALSTIRGLAADAVGELEQVLSVLRDDADGHTRLEEQRDIRDLPALVAAHRDRGARVDLVLPEETPDLAAVVARTLHRVTAEGLANAEKHAPGHPVRVELAVDGSDVAITVANPTSHRPRDPRPGHGLTSLHEQVELVGGTLHAGNDREEWLLEARLPAGVRRGR